MPRKKSIRMSDIAKELNISTVTVSKALADKDGVSEELKKIIKAKALELGYKMSSISKAMRTGIQNNIGILISERYLETNSYYWSLYQSILIELSNNRYFGILEIVKSNEEKDLNTPRIILEKKVDAIIVIGQLRKRYLNNLTKEVDSKLMFLDFYDLYLPVSSVVADNYNGSYFITKYLIERGHKDIVFVGNILETTSIMDRGMGYYKCMLDYELPIRKEWYISDRNNDGFIIEPVLPKKMPTAFVCNSDVTARKLYEVLKKHNYKVPDDISIVGYDNFPKDLNNGIKLTTMAVSQESLSKSAVKIINDIVKGKQVFERINLSCELIEKESVRKLME